jgi:hypothetical protein
MALMMCVPDLTCRHAVRVVSARLRDVLRGTFLFEPPWPVLMTACRG